MTLIEFRSMSPDRLDGLLLALWWDAKGDWNRAHEIAQDVTGADGAWVHAYLHRKEGDLSNAAYWYAQAGRPVAKDDLSAEWERIAVAVLAPKLLKPVQLTGERD